MVCAGSWVGGGKTEWNIECNRPRIETRGNDSRSKKMRGDGVLLYKLPCWWEEMENAFYRTRVFRAELWLNWMEVRLSGKETYMRTSASKSVEWWRHRRGGGRREIERNPPDKKEIKQKNKIPNGFVRGGDGGGHHTSPCHSRREEHNCFFKRGGGGERKRRKGGCWSQVCYLYIYKCVRARMYI